MFAAVGLTTATAAADVAYPTSVANRPLTLPGSILELGANLQFLWEDDPGPELGDIVGLDLGLRGGTGFGEFHAGVLLLLEKPDNMDTFHEFRGGLTGRASRNLAIRWNTSLVNLANDLTTSWRNDLQLRLKGMLSNRVAIVGGGGLLLNWVFVENVDDLMGLFFVADLGIEVQITPKAAIVPRLEFALDIADSPDGYNPDDKIALNLDFLYGFNGSFDFFTGLRIGDDDTGLWPSHRFMFGVNARF